MTLLQNNKLQTEKLKGKDTKLFPTLMNKAMKY